MKKMITCCFVLLLHVLFSSFSAVPGGDVFEVYLNGHRVHQQFIHADRGIKAVNLQALTGSDKLDVLYLHCGQAGTDRRITVRNEKNDLLRELRFNDGNDSRSMMTIYRKDLAKNMTGKTKVYYSSKELPGGRLLAIIDWNTTAITAALQAAANLSL